MYKAPGNLNEFDDSMLEEWNNRITAHFERFQTLHGPRLKRDPSDIVSGGIVDAVRWSGAPAEPEFCLDKAWAKKLSDWGIRGRNSTQNEYCEYNVEYQTDTTGKLRPKRVVFSTELPEYWMVLAQKSPSATRQAASDALGWEPSYYQLYRNPDPDSMNETQRLVSFATHCTGHGQHSGLQQAGVPAYPIGPLNQEHILCMTNPINGLDDLIYILAFGAKEYRTNDNGQHRKSTLDEIFTTKNVARLACRNADPAAAKGAYDAVFAGFSLAFTQNLGMYMRELSKDVFVYNNAPIPDNWIHYSRGEENMYQRITFGPSDSDDVFVDDIYILEGASTEPLTGGYQIARRIEVGPLVIVSEEADEVLETDYENIPSLGSAINCAEASVCEDMSLLKDAYEQANQESSQPRVG